LRAGVLGANDGIVSVAGLVLGVAGATTARGPIFTAGLAGLVAGAVSMALGEYVSVSSQRDTELAALAKEKRELREDPEDELAELAAIYEAKGLRPATARTVAIELTSHDALAAHLDAELGIDPDELTSPWQAAGASALSFFLGALLPLVAILLPPVGWRVPVTFAAVLVALAVTAGVSARIGGANVRRALLRVVLGGALGLGVTYGIGHAFGTAMS
jgi:VIT1/CCC1 family predicted Fe2+/Mn2+ transporter